LFDIFNSVAVINYFKNINLYFPSTLVAYGIILKIPRDFSVKLISLTITEATTVHHWTTVHQLQ